jgi:hypothetical protein
MPSNFRDFQKAGRESAGVLLIPQSVPIGPAIEELLLIWAASDAEEWQNRLEWLPLSGLIELQLRRIGCS